MKMNFYMLMTFLWKFNFYKESRIYLYFLIFNVRLWKSVINNLVIEFHLSSVS